MADLVLRVTVSPWRIKLAKLWLAAYLVAIKMAPTRFCEARAVGQIADFIVRGVRVDG